MPFRTRRSTPLSTLLVSALLPFTACGGDSTSPEPVPSEANTAPTVRLTSLVQDPVTPADVYLTAFYSDGDTLPGNRPVSVSLTVDGASAWQGSVSGPEGTESMKVEAVEKGPHSFRVEVCDGGGLCASHDTAFAIRSADYLVRLRAFDGRAFFPVRGAEFCLDDLCGASDDQGRVVLENVGIDPRRVHDLDGYQPDHLAGLASSRIDPNYFDQTPAMARTGHVPMDTLIALGENRRTILYFSPDFPVEDYAFRWFRPTRHEDEPWLHPSNRPHRLIFDADYALVIRDNPYRLPDLPPEQRDSLYSEVEAVTARVMDTVYARIGFDDPQLFGYIPGNPDYSGPYTGEGQVAVRADDDDWSTPRLWPDPGDFTVEVELGRGWGVDFDLVSTDWGFEQARWYARSGIFLWLCGWKHFDEGQGGGLTDRPFLEEEAVFEFSEEEIAACVMSVAHGSRAVMLEVPGGS